MLMKMSSRWPFIEIERKFLVRSDAWRSKVSQTAIIRQSYLSGVAGLTTRVRQIGNQSLLTYKTKRVGISRGELEIAIPPSYAEWLFSLCPYPAIEKKRHFVPDRGCIWEIDVFLGRHKGLVVAEIELTYPAQFFSLPCWLGDEITHDRRYSNSNLYRTGTYPGCKSNVVRRDEGITVPFVGGNGLLSGRNSETWRYFENELL